MLSLQRELNRVFSQSVPSKTEDGYESSVWTPMVDIQEDEDFYTVMLDLPGVDKKDVKINFTDNVLSVSGERKVEKVEGVVKQFVEREYGKFYRRFSFPGHVDSGNIKAKYDNGVLTLTLPKAEEAKPRSIEIQ
jgi:HSP20 family protein